MKKYFEVVNSDFFSNGPVVAFIWKNNSSWSVEAVSKNIHKLYGYKDEQFLCADIIYADIIHPDDIKRVRKEVEKASLAKVKSFEHKPYRIKDAFGVYRWIEDTTTLLFDENNNISHYIGYIKDITKYIEVQSELEKNLNLIETLIQTLPVPFFVKDADLKYSKFNQAFLDMIGKTSDEILDKTVFDIAPLELAKIYHQADLDLIKAKSQIYESEVLFADKTKHAVVFYKATILNDNGDFYGMLGVVLDITEKIESKKKLEYQKEEFETIFKLSRDGLAVMDLESNFIKVNTAYSTITGLSEQELLETSYFKLSIQEEKENIKDIFKRVLEIGYVDSFEQSFFINGKHIMINMSLSLLPNKQQILASIHDITKYKLFEQQSKMAAMGEMIGNIAHQWRQPLSVISTIASGIKVKKEFGYENELHTLEDMDMIVTQTQYLSKTIDDFRNFISNNHEEEHISIKETINKTLSLLNSALINNNIKVITTLKDDIYINCFQNELIQAFINIINNSKDAIIDKATPNEYKYIFIETKQSKDEFIVEIKDNGGGINTDIIDKIFEPYFTTKHQSVGTGIGLSMTHKILTEHHKAKINAFNIEYDFNGHSFKGACFRIHFK